MTLSLTGPAARRNLPSLPETAAPTVWGVLLVAAFFGGFGTWAALAPLSSAAVGPGQVVVDSNRKTIQHLEGGVIEEILVRDGSHVRAGEPLIRLSTTQAEAIFRTQRGQLDALRAQEARLIAERDGAEVITFPPALANRRAGEPAVREILEGQEKIFLTRRANLAVELGIQEERIKQLRAQIAAHQAQLAASREQGVLLESELRDVRSLVAQGLERRPRQLLLERNLAATKGSVGEYAGRIAQAEQTIGEARLRIVEGRSSFAREVAAELRDTQAKAADIDQTIRSAQDVLRRRDIIAPVDGTVVNLKFFTAGGVITPGSPVLDMIPDNEKLTIETQLKPTDIDVVRVGLPAQIRLTAYNGRSTPILHGKVAFLAADRVTDQKSGNAYYLARVEVERDDLAALPNVELYPGMPTEVMIVTGERTLVDYVIQPITNSMARAFRED